MSLKYKVPFLITCLSVLAGMSNTVGNTSHTYDNARKVITDLVGEKSVIDTTSVALVEKYNVRRPVSAMAQNYDVIYTTNDGAQFRRSGGTRAWRNNNPGCLRFSDFTQNNGAIGHAGGFAVFPDEDTGMRAIFALLRSDKYSAKTIASAMHSYAPPFENDTHAYNRYVQRMTGLAPNLILGSLSDEQIKGLTLAIRRVEGWRIGTEVQTRPDTLFARFVGDKMQKAI